MKALSALSSNIHAVSGVCGGLLPRERWDTGCNPLLSAGRGNNLSQADKQTLLVKLPLYVPLPV